MSHVAEVDLKITDLDALAKACEEVGMELVRGQTTWRWYGRFLNDWSDEQRAAALRGFKPEQFGHSEHAIRLKDRVVGDYEIGLVPRRDGKAGWEMLYDVYGPGHRLEQKAGVALVELRNQYAASVARAQLVKQGYRVTTARNTEGHLQVVAVKA